MTIAYYNENDPKAAAWLRELINRNLIAFGVVDERSIEDIKPDELNGYTQCHFFAGIGVWPHALRRAGWPDDRPVWTGSCPCQPFSAAGKGGGFADERHLWPAWQYLLQKHYPAVIFGEQVSSKDGLAWLDTVQTDLEGAGYAVGANDLCAAGVGAPHIRQRLWFVAERLGDTLNTGLEGLAGHGRTSGKPGRLDAHPDRPAAERGGASGLADTRGEPGKRDARGVFRKEAPQRGEGLKDGYLSNGYSNGCETDGLADTERNQQQQWGGPRSKDPARDEPGIESGGCCETDGLADTEHGDRRANEPRRKTKERTVNGGDCERDTPGPTNGLWRDVDWLGCRDGKWRPVEPGTFPLVNGAAARVGRLRGYGNAINAEVARIFIESYLEADADRGKIN